jgi:hypothetical protein
MDKNPAAGGCAAGRFFAAVGGPTADYSGM